MSDERPKDRTGGRDWSKAEFPVLPSDDQQAAREAAWKGLRDPGHYPVSDGPFFRDGFNAGWDARGVWERGRGVPEATCECGHSEDAHIVMCVHRSEDGSVCGCERKAVAGRGVREDAGAMREALEYLADPESWGGNPLSQEATLYGHDTPYELAVAALAAATPDERKD